MTYDPRRNNKINKTRLSSEEERTSRIHFIREFFPFGEEFLPYNRKPF